MSYWIWFDFGGVLTPPASETFLGFCHRVGVAPADLGTAMFEVAQACGSDDVMAPLDTPLLSAGEWSTRVETVLAERFSVEADLSDFAGKWFADRAPNHALVDCVRGLRQEGRPLGLLSNMVPAFEPHWRTMVDADLFDQIVFSYRLGMRKPQREIYEFASRQADATPDRCVLIDDLEQNCAGARVAGWHAVHHEDNERTITELTALLAHELPGCTQLRPAPAERRSTRR